MTTFIKKNSWTIDLAKIPSYVDWNGDWKYPIDREMIRLILECEELDDNGNPKITQQMKSSFKRNIVDKLRNGVLHIEWSGRCGNLGRRYSAKDPENLDLFSSAGNLGVHSKYIKNTIFQYEGWVDYDMIKGHSSILLSMGKRTHITGGLPAIERFVKEFDNGYAKEMAEYYSIEGEDDKVIEDDIKDLHNRTIYGGGHAKWVEAIEKGNEQWGRNPTPVAKKPPHPKYVEFKTEIQRIINLVYESNPDLVAKICSNPDLELWEKKNRTMSYYCGILENDCLKHAYKYGVDNNLFKPRTIDLCFDGMTAPAPPPYTDMDFHINGMNEYILQKTGIAVKMKVKPFTSTDPNKKSYVIQSIIDARRSLVEAVPAVIMAEVLAENEPVEASPTNNDEEYVIWKNTFEKEWCKIRNTSLFLRKYCENGVFKKNIFQDEKKLIVAYKNQSYNRTLPNGKNQKVCFIKEWLEDNTQLCYEDAGIYPPPLICPPNVYNLWNDSPYESQPFTGANDPDIDKDAVELFCEHIRIICNRDDLSTEWLFSFFAHSLQKPSEKPEHALNLIGNQGIGKTSILNVFSSLYGAGKTLETQQPERDCWGTHNAPMTNAYLVILSETDKRNEYGADGKKKSLITDYPLWINPKGKDQFEVMSYHRIVQLTNTFDPTKTCKDDRRNFILRCNDELKGNTDYFIKFNAAMARPNALRSIYWSFKELDISQWNFRSVPRTKYHQTLIEFTRNPIDLFMADFTYQHKDITEIKLSGIEILAEFRIWREKTGYKFGESMNEGALLKKIKIECGLPDNCIVAGNRGSSGIKNTFNITILKKFYGIGCLIGETFTTEAEEEEFEEIEEDV